MDTEKFPVVIIGPATPEDLIADGEDFYIRSSNGRLYKASVLEDAVPLFNNAKVFNLMDEDGQVSYGYEMPLTRLMGEIHNPVYDADQHRIVATLSAIKAIPNYPLFTTDKKPSDERFRFGLALDAIGRMKRMKIVGHMWDVVTEITKVNSVNLTAKPAAGGKFL